MTDFERRLGGPPSGIADFCLLSLLSFLRSLNYAKEYDSDHGMNREGTNVEGGDITALRNPDPRFDSFLCLV